MAARILICTRPDDLHGLIVAEALEWLGVEAAIWSSQDYPQSQHISIALSNRAHDVVIDELGLQLDKRFDAVWLRRIHWDGSGLAIPTSEPCLARQHSAIFIDHIFDLLPQDARWINRKDNAIRAEYKPSQLKSAAAAGLLIPQTLVSNDPRTIRAFVERLGGVAVAKPLRGECIDQLDGSVLALHAETIESSTLADDQTLAAAPYIYQKKIDVAFEVRVTVMGRSLFAARIDLEADEPVDSHYKVMSVSEFALPQALQEACLRLGEQMGLAFFCVDLLIAKNGKSYFLELNQAGQFLWLERWLPSSRYLATFCSLLLGADKRPNVTLKQVLGSPRFAQRLQECALRKAAAPSTGLSSYGPETEARR